MQNREILMLACGAKYICDDTTLLQPPTNFDCVYGRSGRTLNYDEIVVYDVDAVMPQYIILVKNTTINSGNTIISLS